MNDINEDIKILEEMITWDCLLPNKRQTESIENLIKGYKELEKRIIYLTNLLCMSDETYIRKSKIKEIRDKAEVMDYYVLSDVIEDLNKLLGDEKNESKF